MHFRGILKLYLLFFFVACFENKSKVEYSKPVTETISQQDHRKSEKYPAQYELPDSIHLTPIKNEFYRNQFGFLYEKTTAQREFNGELKDVEYFNGIISQEIDPNSFQQIGNSWFAKDHKNIYYSRPTSGGWQITKVEHADVNTFKIIDGNYKYAVDKNNFFNATEKIEGFIPLKTEQIKDKEGKVIKLKMKNKKLDLEP
ncbi:DKNYY domain-containing protein [Chryseobacterium sp. c4a]|uniref:DKNYY domain-containing protein n=1 Tax=Chryseobacterium sp. c4a TaxID=1573582 RepID=UPI00135BF985|nr:DKNYY domain-containing protein [Chryseobacterium sp. c4a]